VQKKKMKARPVLKPKKVEEEEKREKEKETKKQAPAAKPSCTRGP